MTTLYFIKGWEDHFETSETRKLENLKWVPTPNKHDGLGFRRIATRRDRAELFAAWNLILQIASKGRRKDRGQLIRDGQPLTALDLALMTGFPQSLFESALSFFSSEVQWLGEIVCQGSSAHLVGLEGNLNDPAGKTAGAAGKAESPAAEWKGMEGNGKEVKGKERLTDEQFILELQEKSPGINVKSEIQKMERWLLLPQNKNRKLTRKFIIGWINRADPEVPKSQTEYSRPASVPTWRPGDPEPE